MNRGHDVTQVWMHFTINYANEINAVVLQHLPTIQNN